MTLDAKIEQKIGVGSALAMAIYLQ